MRNQISTKFEISCSERYIQKFDPQRCLCILVEIKRYKTQRNDFINEVHYKKKLKNLCC